MDFNSNDLNICVVGLGYVGLPLAVKFGLTKNIAKMIADKDIPVITTVSTQARYFPILRAQLQNHLQCHRTTFRTRGNCLGDQQILPTTAIFWLADFALTTPFVKVISR